MGHQTIDDLIPHAVVKLLALQDLTPATAWRMHLNLTQGEVAVRMGLTQSAYAQLEGISKLRKLSRERIARALGIAPGQLDV
jgi:transcriptional regulator with XRE-family HTH domain